MALHQQLILLLCVTYFIGAIPFGLIVGKLKGIDVRTAGSRNIGATNVGRLLGVRYFWIVFLLDLCKSLVPMLIASALVASQEQATRTQLTYVLWLGVGIAAMLGHIFPIYLGFRGGKGVATSAGVVLGLFPYFTLAGAIAIGVFVLVFGMSRIISLGSIIGSMAFPISYVLVGMQRGWDVFGEQLPLLVLSCAMYGLILYRHRENIRRLRAGTEPKFARSKVTP